MAFSKPQFLVETEWLQAHLDEPELRIFDCTVFLANYFKPSAAEKIEVVSGREHWEREHIPGSAFVEVVRDLCDPQNKRFMFPFPSAEQFEAAMSRHGVGERTRVVLYDGSANIWAARVWWMLRTFGFDNAAVLSGGWKKWKREGRPVSATPATYPQAQFVVRPRPQLIVTKDDVLAAIGDRSTCIVNALTPDEYAGRGPVRYRRPGHIPSSVNVSALGLIDPATHAFLGSEQIRAQFAMVGAIDAQRVITHCGAGLAASSVALALTLLGVENVALYDGSMFEWAADPTLPLVTGDRA